MKSYSDVIEKIHRTPNVTSVRIKKSISFKAGQYFRVYSNNDSRYLSASCSPLRDYLEFTKKITNSDFSSWLQALEPGQHVAIEGPYGRFTIDTEDKILFVAGGIGITPIFSLIEDAFLSSSTNDFVLLYGNKSYNDIAFYNELTYYSQRLKLGLFIFTEEKREGFYHGLIDVEKICGLVSDVDKRTVFVCGSPSMVELITQQIAKGNLSKKVKTEKLIGY
ncbi:MAG TPA: FAD-dependent oxidoreductase [bacterium]|nr:FAD-dependent oxidoreductase [bacterium]